MLNKKGLSVLAAAMMVAGVVNTVSAEVVYRVNGNVDYADLYAYMPTGRMTVSLDQIKNNSNNSTSTYSSTYLYYYIYTYGVGYSYWSGIIDSADVTGDGNGNFSLSTDTCLYNPTPSCGVVELNWQKDGEYSTRISGVSRTETSNYTRQETGTKTSYGSAVTGMVNGMSVADAYYVNGGQGSRNTSNLLITHK